jgi:hypothetical protein
MKSYLMGDRYGLEIAYAVISVSGLPETPNGLDIAIAAFAGDRPAQHLLQV